MSDVLIQCDNVGKKFCRDLKKSLWYGVKDSAADLLRLDGRQQHQLRAGEFWANENINFELKRGECLGLIGRNGAGKTTLLKMLSGLIKPDVGKIEVRGRVGAMIALGAGFNPILTGRENVYIAASVLGLSKSEIDAKFDDIVDFAELKEFMDTPVRSYSSGMQVRLGFAVASSIEPDVLVIDEVLAVGDIGFRTKCYNRVYELCKRAAVIFVSHSMPQVDRLCSRGMVLSNGKEVFHGDTGPAIGAYNRLFSSGSTVPQLASGVELADISANGSLLKERMDFVGGMPFEFEFSIGLPNHVHSIEISVSFLQPSHDLICQINNLQLQSEFTVSSPQMHCFVKIPSLTLGDGLKLITLIVRNAVTNEMLCWAPGLAELLVSNPEYVPAPMFCSGAMSLKPV